MAHQYVPYGEPSPSQEGNCPPDKINVYEENMPKETLSGVDLIAKERQEQIEKHGYTAQADADHINGELIAAAVSILREKPSKWPWTNTERAVKIVKKSRIEQLKIAGAFVAAEIDRLQSANNK